MNAGISPLLTNVEAPPAVATEPVLGVPLAITDYEATLDWIDAAVAAQHRGYVCVAAVHTVMASQEDPALRAAVQGADFTVPDGQPLVWALRALGHPLEDRVYGPELMDRACARAARTGQRFFLYGGRNQGALVELTRMLRLRHPGLKIVGGYAPPFRELTDAEDEAVALRDQALGRGRRVGRHRRAQAGEVDGADARPPRRPRADRRGRGVRLPRRDHSPGPAADAALRAGVAVPVASGAAPPVEALPDVQPAVRARLRAPIRARLASAA